MNLSAMPYAVPGLFSALISFLTFGYKLHLYLETDWSIRVWNTNNKAKLTHRGMIFTEDECNFSSVPAGRQVSVSPQAR